MDVQTDTQRQDKERTHPRNNESDAGCQKYHGATTELAEKTIEEHIGRTEESVKNGCTRDKNT